MPKTFAVLIQARDCDLDDRRVSPRMSRGLLDAITEALSEALVRDGASPKVITARKRASNCRGDSGAIRDRGE
jgi:hypothetical protein